MRHRVARKWRPPLSLVLGGSLAAVLVLPVFGAALALWLTPLLGGAWAAGLVVLGAGMATVVLGYLLWRLILSPVRALGHEAAHIRQGGAPRAIGRTGTPEISEVADIVLDMAEALRSREMSVRGYTDHVTHELKAPLTAIRGAAELLDGDAALGDEARGLVRTIVEAEARAERLLAAARQVVSARTPTHQGETCLAEGVAGWRNRYPMIDIGTKGETIPLPIALSGLDIVVGHLAENAVAAGASRLDLSATDSEGRVRLEVADDGSGVSPGNGTRVFDPFFTTRRDDGGTGMGLAVVDTMLRAQGAEIELLDGVAGQGARFEIRF